MAEDWKRRSWPDVSGGAGAGGNGGATYRLEVLGDLTNKTLEGQLADEELGRLLVATDLTESDGTRLVAVGLLDATGRGGGLAGGLGSKLLTRGLATGGLACGIVLAWCCDARRGPGWRGETAAAADKATAHRQCEGCGETAGTGKKDLRAVCLVRAMANDGDDDS